MKKKPLAFGLVAIGLLGVFCSSGCAQNDNGPSTVHNSATDFQKKKTLTPAQQAAIESNPHISAATKAAILGRYGASQGGALPPQIAARQAQPKK